MRLDWNGSDRNWPRNMGAYQDENEADCDEDVCTGRGKEPEEGAGVKLGFVGKVLDEDDAGGGVEATDWRSVLVTAETEWG